jgi:hypothetical protein
MATLRAGDFRAGEPVELSLKYTSFRHVAGAFGPQAMAKTSLGTLYLDPEPASNIETQMRDLAIAPGGEDPDHTDEKAPWIWLGYPAHRAHARKACEIA